MPIVRGKRQHDGHTLKEAPTAKRRRRAYDEFGDIGYTQDHCHTLIRNIPENLLQFQNELMLYTGSFLNGDGGILCYGAKPNGVVYGMYVNRKNEDVFKLCIDEVMKKIHPMVSPNRYRVTFTPVVMRSNSSFYRVLEIRMARGDPYEIYEDSRHEIYVRKGSVPYGPLKPWEIVDLAKNQLLAKRKAERKLKVSLLCTPEPSKKPVEKPDKNKPAVCREQSIPGNSKDNPINISNSTTKELAKENQGKITGNPKKRPLHDGEAPLPPLPPLSHVTAPPDNQKPFPLDTNKQLCKQKIITPVITKQTRAPLQAPLLQENDKNSTNTKRKAIPNKLAQVDEPLAKKAKNSSQPSTAVKSVKPQTQPKAIQPVQSKAVAVSQPVQPKAVANTSTPVQPKSAAEWVTRRVTRSMSRLLARTPATEKPPTQENTGKKPPPTQKRKSEATKAPVQKKAAALKTKLTTAFGLLKSKAKAVTAAVKSTPATTADVAVRKKTPSIAKLIKATPKLVASKIEQKASKPVKPAKPVTSNPTPPSATSSNAPPKPLVPYHATPPSSPKPLMPHSVDAACCARNLAALTCTRPPFRPPPPLAARQVPPTHRPPLAARQAPPSRLPPFAGHQAPPHYPSKLVRPPSSSSSTSARYAPSPLTLYNAYYSNPPPPPPPQHQAPPRPYGGYCHYPRAQGYGQRPQYNGGYYGNGRSVYGVRM